MTNRVDEWVSSLSIRKQKVVMATMVVMVVSVLFTIFLMAFILAARRFFDASFWYPLWAAPVFGIVVGVIIVIKDRDELVPEGGFNP